MKKKGRYSRIIEEYERIAYGDDEAVKIGDKMKALEQLRILSDAQRLEEGKAGSGSEVQIRIEYV